MCTCVCVCACMGAYVRVLHVFEAYMCVWTVGGRQNKLRNLFYFSYADCGALGI